ncbi:MAG: heparan-alpha-glucosaminide N-acetyltransferase domain-containing protein [Candidatus Thermoplasmatota archaeon]|nr:heparan-alpha-glucosaminide N-acetyltransferase domain-containing protein [Candidatus Thermoplasmatota archaeon]
MEKIVRNRTVDSLRGLAVLLMVMVHAAATWNPFYSAQSSILAYSVAGLGGLAAPLFVTIFGWGLAKSRASQRSNLIKAIILLLLQVIVNLSSPHLYDVFTPGILSLFALLILLKPLILKIISTMQTLFGFVGITVVMILFNDLVYNIQGSNSWDSRVFTDSIVTALNHLLLTGTYPLFPWMIYAVVGAFLGSSITEGGKTLPRNNTTLLLIIIGVCYCLFTLISANVTGSIWAHPTEGDYLNFFPANIGFLIGSMTGVLIFWLLIQEGKILVFESSGRLSLTIYTFHFIPLTLLSNLENEKDWTVMEASQAVVLFTTAWLIFAFVWNKFQWLTIENLIRKLSSG